MTALSLDEYDVSPEPVGENRETFRVENDSQAAWAMRKLRAIRTKQAEAEAIAHAEHERIEAWLADAKKATSGDEAFFEGLLIAYAMRQRVTENRKSITLPHGSIKSRAAQPSVKVADADAFIMWAKTYGPEFIRTKVEPDLSAIRRDCDLSGNEAVNMATGEVVPGVIIQQRDATFSVEVNL